MTREPSDPGGMQMARSAKRTATVWYTTYY